MYTAPLYPFLYLFYTLIFPVVRRLVGLNNQDALVSHRTAPILGERPLPSPNRHGVHLRVCRCRPEVGSQSRTV
jgi:hypothetical protein